MRALVLLLVLAVSPLTLTVCQLTCATQVAVHQHATEAPACHESTEGSDGPPFRQKASAATSKGDLLRAKASPAFQLSVMPTSAPAFVLRVERPISSLDATAIPATSPPLLLPLRIAA